MLDLIFAIKDIQRIKNGEKAKLSNRQIVNVIVNLIDAKKNLQEDDYKKVYEIYNFYNKQKDKMEMDLDILLTRTAFIVSKFDEIAPVELYNGQDSIFLSKTEKEKYIEKANLNELINMQKQTLEKTKSDSGNNTVEKVQEMFEKNLISEQQREEVINTINSLNITISETPNNIKVLEEKLKGFDNKKEQEEENDIFEVDDDKLNSAIEKLNKEKIGIIFPNGYEQMINVGKELLYYLNGKFSIEEMYSLYIRDYFFFLIDGDIYELYIHMQMRYSKILSKEEQIRLMAILFMNRSNPNYKFSPDDNMEWSINFINDVINKTEENDNEGVMRGATGKFGIEKINPIPVCGHNGVKEYFKNICLENNHEIKYERQGSIGAENINGIVDVYTIFDVETEEKVCDLFVCIYNKHTSKIIPEGFIIKENKNGV